MNIVTRPYDPKTDESLLFSRWIHAAKYETSTENRAAEWEDFRDEIEPHIRECIANGDVLVAVSQEDPSLILGSAVVVGQNLSWIFVKPGYRCSGIAKMLLNAFPQVQTYNSPYMTRLGQAILEAKEKAHAP